MKDASIGPYRVVDRLGAGGMGEVYLAIDTRLNRKVALKYLSDPSLDLPHIRERLLREARAAAQIGHPNIAAIYDILDTATPPCIVMEYVPGETLGHVAARGPMPPAQAVSIGAQLAGALAHAHAAGVVHRDLKPANVVLAPDGNVKILDFGLARVREVEQDAAPADASTHEASRSQAGGIAGTPAYMAPEQLAGRPANPLSDVYSLGVTLYELLTGRRPFSGRTTSDVVYEVMFSPTPLASAANQSVPPLLDAIVAKAMAREASHRYQSAAELAADLRQAERAIDDNAALGPSSGGLDARSPAPARRWRPLAVAGLCVGLALMAGWAYTWRRSQPAGAPVASMSVAVLPFTSDKSDPEALRAGLGFSESIVMALEGLSSVTVLTRPEYADYLAAAPDRVRRAGELGVSMVVTGQVALTPPGREVVVTVQRPDGKAVLSRKYVGRGPDLTPLERKATADVVAALGVSLTAADRERLRRVPACRDDAFADYLEGRERLNREDVPGNAARAGQAFALAISKDASCAPAHVGLADARWAEFRETKDQSLVERARQALDTAAALDPDSPSINRAYAELYLGTGRPDQAEKVLRGVIEHRPFDDGPHRMLSEVLVKQGRTEEARSELQQALRLRPNNVVNHVALGNSCLRSGRLPEAVQAYTRALTIQPDNVWAISNLAVAYAFGGERWKAIAVYESVRDPDATTLSNLSALYSEEGRYEEAARLLTKALALEPRSDVKHGNLGDTYQRMGRTNDAAAERRKAAELALEQLKVDDRDAATLARLAVYEAKLGRSAEALRHAGRAVALSPDDNTVLYKRAVVHALAGQRSAAVEWLRKAIEKGYSPSRAREDTDIASITKLPEVVALLRAATRG